MHTPPRHLFLTGMAVGLNLLDGFEFDPNAPYRACRICGAVYQSNADRDPSLPAYIGAELRQKWAVSHHAKHPLRAHLALAESGRFLTALAAQRLVAYGVIPVSDILFDEEIQQAVEESSPIPERGLA